MTQEIETRQFTARSNSRPALGILPDHARQQIRHARLKPMARPPRWRTSSQDPNKTAPPEPGADRILQLGLGFWGSKTLLSAVELGVFTALGDCSKTLRELATELGLHERCARDYLDALVALRVLDRVNGQYRNTPESALYLDKSKPGYVGGLLEMANHRLYSSWGSLTTALRTGKPQNEICHAENLFDALYQDPARVREFAKAMTGISLPAARAIADIFPWRNHRSFIDIGCAQGCLPVQLALTHSHLQGAGLDLPVVGPVFEDYVKEFRLSDRLRFLSVDFMSDEPLPTADVLIFGHILHDWDLPTKMKLLTKAFAALPQGGAVIVYEALIDDDRRSNAFGLLMSLNMLIETKGGFDFTGADCCRWMREVGFRQTEVRHLVGPDSMVIGIK
jgi:hypothetical protein